MMSFYNCANERSTNVMIFTLSIHAKKPVLRRAGVLDRQYVHINFVEDREKGKLA
jgi:hypothetical protein